MSADAFIPAFIYVVVHCDIDDVLTLKNLLVAFTLASHQTRTGETAYFVTCLEIAIEYIQSLVILEEVEFDRHRPLGIEFHRERGVVVVHRVLDKYMKSHNVKTERSNTADDDDDGDSRYTIESGDVLMAINGVSAHDKTLRDVKRVIDGIQGPVALAFLKWEEYRDKVHVRSAVSAPSSRI
jgi:hypothetical protein